MNKTSQDIPLPALQVQTHFHYVYIYTNNFDKCVKLKINLLDKGTATKLATNCNFHILEN